MYRQHRQPNGLPKPLDYADGSLRTPKRRIQGYHRSAASQKVLLMAYETVQGSVFRAFGGLFSAAWSILNFVAEVIVMQTPLSREA
jgi:hypothetical protein